MTKADEATPFPIVPVLRPLLPDAASVTPYLVRIDAARIYSNFGPLSEEFSERLAGFVGVPRDAVLPVSSGTAGLIAAILAVAKFDHGRRRVALMPSFTFVATAIAAERCGLRPYFVDVDPESWALDPERLMDFPHLDQVAVVIVVAPFGRPPRQSDWLAFQQRTGIPVVFDCAASFALIGAHRGDALGQIPAVFSFHATKSFGVGEGGCIVCTEPDRLERMTAAVNFGFSGARDSLAPSINGKMNEYAAAVGLAALDGWAAKRDAIARVSTLYRAHFAQAGLAGRFLCWPDIDGNYALFRAADTERDAILRAFDKGGVEYRLWYGEGVHRQTHFAGAAREDLPVTEAIAGNLIGIPMAPDMSEESVRRVVRAAASVGGKSEAPRPGMKH